MKAKEIIDARTHGTTWDPVGQQVAQFVAGVYATKDPFEIDFLRNYNKRSPDSVIEVREDMLNAE